jgi:hypothetical protein
MATTISFGWAQSDGTPVDRYAISHTYTIRGAGCDLILTGDTLEVENGTGNYTLTG